MSKGISLAEALAHYRPDAELGPLPELTGIDALLNSYDPDHLRDSLVKLAIGAHARERGQRERAGGARAAGPPPTRRSRFSGISRTPCAAATTPAIRRWYPR